MMTTTLTCDRCGEPATEWWRMTRHAYLDQMRHDAHDLMEMDLCPRCAEELRAWCDGRKRDDDGRVSGERQ